MLLVIFGAGASFDSIDPNVTLPPAAGDRWENFRPPLAKQLVDGRANFNRAMDRYPPAKALIADLRPKVLASSGNIETLLEAARAEAEDDPMVESQLMALKFYLQEVIDECGREWSKYAGDATNYLALLQRIERWRRQNNERVLLVTFNYDTMLESACKLRLRMDFAQPELHGYIGHDRYRLIKPHGSVNWGRVTLDSSITVNRRQLSLKRAMIDRPAELTISEEFRLLPSLGDPRTEPKRSAMILAPALAIPVEAKSVFECPDEHLNALARWLPEVERVLVVGWRAAERNFLEMIKEARKKAPRAVMAEVVCGKPKEGEDVVPALKYGFGAAPARVFKGGFSDFLRSDNLEALLNTRDPMLWPPRTTVMT